MAAVVAVVVEVRVIGVVVCVRIVTQSLEMSCFCSVCCAAVRGTANIATLAGQFIVVLIVHKQFTFCMSCLAFLSKKHIESASNKSESTYTI